MEGRQQTKAQQLAMILTWQQSGQSQKHFCLQNNIAYHVFHYLYKVYRNQLAANSGSFVVVNIAAQVQSNSPILN